jgi:hypothetical protein
MNQFLNALRVDLLDRRRRPLLIAALAALIAAVAYAALAGGSSSPQASGPEPTLGASGVRVTQGQPSADQAVAETTGGASQQHGGGSRDPFTPLPGAIQQPSKATTSTASSGSSTTTSATSAGGGGGTNSGAGHGTSPVHHVKFKTVYRVSVLFGKAAPGTPALEANLTPYEDLRQNQLIPSKQHPVIAFRGVLTGAESAAFTIVGEVIPRGPGVCKPSPVQCQAINLKVGQTEELEEIAANGEAVNFELQVASIVFVTSAKAAAASDHSYGGGVSKDGSSLLRHLGLLALPGLRYSPHTNLLYVPAAAHAAVRAHSAVRRAR